MELIQVKKLIIMYFFISNFIFSSEIVYVVNTKKYHIDKTCRTLKKAKNIKKISFKSVGSRTACKVCS